MIGQVSKVGQNGMFLVGFIGIHFAYKYHIPRRHQLHSRANSKLFCKLEKHRNRSQVRYEDNGSSTYAVTLCLDRLTTTNFSTRNRRLIQRTVQ